MQRCYSTDHLCTLYAVLLCRNVVECIPINQPADKLSGPQIVTYIAVYIPLPRVYIVFSTYLCWLLPAYTYVEISLPRHVGCWYLITSASQASGSRYYSNYIPPYRQAGRQSFIPRNTYVQIKQTSSKISLASQPL